MFDLLFGLRRGKLTAPSWEETMKKRGWHKSYALGGPNPRCATINILTICFHWWGIAILLTRTASILLIFHYLMTAVWQTLYICIQFSHDVVFSLESVVFRNRVTVIQIDAHYFRYDDISPHPPTAESTANLIQCFSAALQSTDQQAGGLPTGRCPQGFGATRPKKNFSQKFNQTNK